MALWGIYLRLSADDKRGGKVTEANSIQGQRRICRAYIERIDPDATMIEFAEEEFISASKGLDRPEYKRMLAAMVDGDLDHIVARDQDRFTRDRDVEFGELKKLAKQAGVKVHAADSGELFDSPEREMASGIRSEFGQYFSQLLSKNVRRGTQTRRESGHWTGMVVFGYSKGGVINPEQAEHIRWAYDQILNHGKTAQYVFERWLASGVLTVTGRPWSSVGAVIRMLKSPTIAGLVSHKGKILEGVEAQWEPIVTPDERDQMLAHFKARRKNERAYGKRVRRTRTLAGKVLCGGPECDAKTMTSVQPGGRDYWYWQHRPRNGGCGNSIRGPELDTVIRAVATYLVGQTPPPADAQMPDFDDSELRDIEQQIAEVRADMIAGHMRAADARPVLDGLNARKDEQEALRAKHAEDQQVARSWNSAHMDAIYAGDAGSIRGVIDNVRVLPDHAGVIIEGANGRTITLDKFWYMAVLEDPSVLAHIEGMTEVKDGSLTPAA